MSTNPMEAALAAKEQAELEIANIEIDIIKPIAARLKSPPVIKLINDLKSAQDLLKGGFVYEQLGHLLVVLGNVPTIIEQRIEQHNALINPPSLTPAMLNPSPGNQ